MPTDYLIKGTGGTLSGDYLLGADLLGVDASLRFENLAPDVLQWTCRTESIDAAETTIPDVGQRIELWNTAGTVRYFRGWVTQARATNYGVQVVVEGPWQFLQKIDITSSVSSGTNTDFRPTINFNESTVKANIEALLTRAIALGAPMIVGTIASTFTIPKLQLSMMSCADVLAELMRWVPDCVGWWDYSGASDPIFNLTRRSGMGTRTFAIGTDPVEDYDLTGRPDLRPSQVVIKYTRRRLSPADGRPEFAEQSSGSPVAGRIQTIGLSGKELDTFLPPDDYQGYTVQTYDANATLNNTRIRLLPIIPEVVASRAQFAGRPNANDVVLANGETITLQTSVSTVGTRIYPQPALQFLNPETGAPISRVNKRFLMSPPPPDWANGVLANAEKVKIVGRIYKLVESTLLDSLGGNGINAPNIEDWAVAFPWSIQLLLTGYRPSTTILGYPWARVLLYALDFEVETYLTTSNFPNPTTIYKPQDYDFNAPPSGLASSLLAAQNFTPYEGSITLKRSGFQFPQNQIPYLYRVTGAQAGLATADAMAKAVTFDLAQSTEQIEIGAPARFAFGVLGGKVRQTPQTNITIN